MRLLKAEMNEKRAKEILNWKYEPPYDFYNNESPDSGMAELLNGTYYAVLNDIKETVGFFCSGESAQVPSGKCSGVYGNSFIDVGLGMNPKLVGKGNGIEFGLFVQHSIEETHEELPVRLTVATFNKRAIHLYKRLGFSSHKQFSTDAAEFITMINKY